MEHDFGKVAVLMGGTSGEREISLQSGQAVLDALVENGVDAHAMDVSKAVFNQLQAQEFERAFIVLHGCGGEDGTIQGGLEIIGMPYTGSGVMASSLCMDKYMTKQLWRAAGVPTPKFMRVNEDTDHHSIVAAIGLPMVIKPALEGSSLGVSKVNDEAELEQALNTAQQFRGDILAEQWVQGKEYTVGVLNDAPLPVIRLQTPNVFYDFAAKYQSDETQYHCPCGLEEEQESRLQGQALEAFRATGASGWGRVDAMVDDRGNFWFLEVNTVPGMTSHSLVPMAAKANGQSFEQLVMQILATSDKAVA